MTDTFLVEEAVPLPKENVTVDSHPSRTSHFPNHDQTADDVDNIDVLQGLISLWYVVMRRKRLAIDLFLGCFAISLAFSLLLTPIYKSEVLLSIVGSEKSGGLGGGISDLSPLIGLGGGASGRGDAIAILTSRTLVESFIRKNNLLPVLFPQSWDDNKKSWKSGEEPTQAEAHRLFMSICNVSDDRKMGLVTLSIYWKDPNVAAAWANDLVQEADFIKRRDAIEETQRSIAFLEAETRKTSIVETQQTIQQLMEVQVRKNMVANTAGRYSYKVIDRATAPDLRDSPKRVLIMIIGTFVGLILGILVPWFSERYSELRIRIRQLPHD